MRKKIITLSAVAAVSAGFAGVGLARGSDTPTAPTNPTAQKMSVDSMGDMGDMGAMGGGRDMQGRAMRGPLSDADVTAMAKGMGMKLDPASVQRMVRMHNGMMRGTDAMMEHR